MNEIKCYTVAIGNLPLPWQIRKVKMAKEALNFINKLEGFVGYFPCYPKGILCLFKTENDAKGARNEMKAKGIQVGTNIGEVFVEAKYIEENEARLHDNK